MARPAGEYFHKIPTRGALKPDLVESGGASQIGARSYAVFLFETRSGFKYAPVPHSEDFQRAWYYATHPAFSKSCKISVHYVSHNFLLAASSYVRTDEDIKKYGYGDCFKA